MLALTIYTTAVHAAEIELLDPLTIVVSGESQTREVKVYVRDRDGFLVAVRRIVVRDDGKYRRKLELWEGYRGALTIEQTNIETTE